MNSKAVLIGCLIQLILLHSAYSQPLHNDLPEGKAIANLTDSHAYQSSGNTAISQSAIAETGIESSKPLYRQISNYSVEIQPNDDSADIYYPNQSDLVDGTGKLPFALLLQGANVDKSFYSGFARTVASYGFIVVIPNHRSTSIIMNGLYAEESEVNEVLSFMIAENSREDSPLNQRIDTDTMVLLGHSYGGAASLYAIQGSCQLPFCIGFGFHRPDALTGGAFYGPNLKGPIGSLPELDNHGLPICLIQGSVDGMATPAETEETYNNIKDEPKANVLIQGANHYGITDVNDPPGAKPDENAQLISQQESIEAIGRNASLFLRHYALGQAA